MSEEIKDQTTEIQDQALDEVAAGRSFSSAMARDLYSKMKDWVAKGYTPHQAALEYGPTIPYQSIDYGVKEEAIEEYLISIWEWPVR